MGERSAESSVDSVSGERQEHHFGRRIRAVVADDSADWRSVVAALLKEEDDVEVVAQVGNGQEAIEAVTVLHPELAIIDLRIGNLDALTTTSLLRHQFPLLDVILMADRDSLRLRATCQASGIKYVVKKAKFHEEFPPVLAQIRNCLGASAVVGNDANDVHESWLRGGMCRSHATAPGKSFSPTSLPGPFLQTGQLKTNEALRATT